MRTAKIVLGDEEYEIRELRSRENAAWRHQLESIVDDVAGLLEGLPEVDLTSGSALAQLVRDVGGQMLGSVTTIRTLVVAYAPELAPALDEAYDSEIVAAFKTILLDLAYPFGFGGLRQTLADLIRLGSQYRPTTPSWPSRNGAAGTTS